MVIDAKEALRISLEGGELDIAMREIAFRASHGERNAIVKSSAVSSKAWADLQLLGYKVVQEQPGWVTIAW